MKKKCFVIMLPTNTADSAILVFNGKHKFAEYHKNKMFTQQYLSSMGTSGARSYHLYVVSDDEIKEDDHFIITDQIYTCIETLDSDKQIHYRDEINGSRVVSQTVSKKIIATTDSLLRLPFLSPEFIQKYVDEYNKGNQIKEVMVEYMIDTVGCIQTEGNDVGLIKDTIKVDKNNYIAITTSKEAWTRDEVVNLCLKAMRHGKHIQAYHQSGMGAKHAPISENQWLIDNL